jgi:DNA repair exonuclease SbcCD nuclease subunit
MKARFIHTADWQLGKPFAGVEDNEKRVLLRNERFTVLQRIAEKAREFQAEFVVVAGDLFDSPSATRATVSAACSAIGALGIPVFAIPGNHDHGGPGSLWEQDFFRRECEQLAPNLRVLLKPEPVELPNAVLFPCPLLRRRETADPTAWLRAMDHPGAPYHDKPRIVLAHGSVEGFGALSDDEEADSGLANYIDLTRLEQAQWDYVALGDWHGTKRITAKAWYAGTPELDRFIKGDEHDPGNVLAVEAERGHDPLVRRLKTAAIGWHELEVHFADDTGLDLLEQQVDGTVGDWKARHLLRLRLSGALGMDAANRLEQLLETWKARLLRLKLDDGTTIAPSAAELDELARRADDPLISRVAAKLITDLDAPDEEGAIARTALRELYAVCNPT